jgi:hypothetical protein
VGPSGIPASLFGNSSPLTQGSTPSIKHVIPNACTGFIHHCGVCGPIRESGVAFWQSIAAQPGYHTFNKSRCTQRVYGFYTPLWCLCRPFRESGIAFWQSIAAQPGFHTFRSYVLKPSRQVRFQVVRPAGPIATLQVRLQVMRPAGHMAIRQVRLHASCGAHGHTTGTTSGRVHASCRAQSHATGTTLGVLRGTSHSSGMISGHASCGAQATLPVRLQDASCEVQGHASGTTSVYIFFRL